MGRGFSGETYSLPGAIDLHVHLREPSTNQAETIYGGTRAAMLGGFVLVADMPNNPGKPTWTRERLEEKIEIAHRDSYIPIGFYAGSQPESDNVGQLGGMSDRAIGLKLYGDPTTGNANTYEAADFRDIVAEWDLVAPNKPIMFHAGEDNLEAMIDLVAREYEHHLHVCHVNSRTQVELVQSAKDTGLNVTCGVCPHHLLKTSYDVVTQGTFAEMKPPLAHQDEAEYLMQLLARGEIDVIESDFAPHTADAKYEAENEGGHCFGVPGIEHVFPLLFYQMKKGRLSERSLINATFYRPMEILGLKTSPGNIVKWDTSGGVYRIEQEDVEATCGWTPYLGMLAIGRLSEVTIGGTTLVKDGVQDRAWFPQIITSRNETIGEISKGGIA